jgi:hypothetical protein
MLESFGAVAIREGLGKDVIAVIVKKNHEMPVASV